MNALVTIVVPVYNVEKYLDRCLLSLVNQSYKNIEILLIDDGSLDSSGKKCDEWSKKDTRIKVIHKENSGLGFARNTGIDNAKGDYLCFCDSDDSLHEDAIQKCIDTFIEYDADVVNFGFNYINSEMIISKIRKPKNYFIYDGKNILDIFLPQLMGFDSNEDLGFCMSSCASMYSLELIKKVNWRFVSEREIISEDFYSLLHLYKHVNRVVTIPYAFYSYYYNDNSLTHVFREDRIDKNAYFYMRTQQAIEELGYNDKIKYSFNFLYLGNCIAAMKQIVSCQYNFKKKYMILRKAIFDKTLLTSIKICKKGASFQRKVLFTFIEYKLVILTYILLKLKT